MGMPTYAPAWVTLLLTWACEFDLPFIFITCLKLILSTLIFQCSNSLSFHMQVLSARFNGFTVVWLTALCNIFQDVAAAVCSWWHMLISDSYHGNGSHVFCCHTSLSWGWHHYSFVIWMLKLWVLYSLIPCAALVLASRTVEACPFQRVFVTPILKSRPWCFGAIQCMQPSFRILSSTTALCPCAFL